MNLLHPEILKARPLVLVVEDEPMLLMMYEDAVVDAGAVAVTASSLDEAMSRLSRDIDVAILDIRLGEDRVFPVAYRLMEAGIPFLFCSGTAGDMPQDDLSKIILMHKPVSADRVVSRALGLVAADHACHG